MTTNAHIPSEILLEIFQQSLPKRLDQEGRMTFQTIRSVCPRWRSISLSSPTLWSSISVARRLSDHDRVQISRLETWFSRSGPCIPLELDFSTGKMVLEATAALVSLIRRHQHRWTFLSLLVEPECFWDVLLRHPSQDWTSLHTLKLWTCDFAVVDEKKELEGLEELGKISSLRCLIVDDVEEHTFKKRYGPMTLEELHLDVEHFGISQGHLISSYPNLTQLVLVDTSVHGAKFLTPQDHFHWPTLTSFVFEVYNLNLLAHFTTPRLAQLAIRLHRFNAIFNYQGIVSGFLTRCTSTLRSITVDSRSDGKLVAQFLPLFSSQRHVTHLSLDLWPSIQEADNITQDSEREWFPDLRHLTVSMPSGTMAALKRTECLAAFLRRREEFGLEELEILTVRRCIGAASFPYKFFEKVRVGKLCVTVPW